MKRLTNFLPNLRQAWILVLLLTVVGSILVAAVTLPFSLLLPSITKQLEFLLYPIIFIPPLLYIDRQTKKQVTEDKQLLLISTPNYGRAGVAPHFIALFLLLFAVNYVIEPLTSWMGTPQFLEELTKSIFDYKISAFVSVVIFAPLLEELLCRGVILRGLLNHTTPTRAILWSALIFGVIHLNPWQAIPAFILGAIMGWVYWKSRSLWSTIFLHFVNNLFSYTITVLYPSLPVDAGFKDILPTQLYYILYLVALIVTATTILFINKQYKHAIPSEV